MGIVGAADRETAIAGGANRNVAGCLVADVTVDIGIDDVLSGSVELRKRLAEFVPVLRRIDIEKWHAQAVIERPAQCQLARLARNQFADDGAMPRDLYINRYIRLTFDVNHLYRGVRAAASPAASDMLPFSLKVSMNASVTVGPTLVNPQAIRWLCPTIT